MNGFELIEPTKIYVKTVLELRDGITIKAMAHITGGGLLDNVPRVLPEDCAVAIDSSTWEMPPIMKLIQSEGNIDQNEMYRTFNCGIGMVLVIDSDDDDVVIEKLQSLGEEAYVIGDVISKEDDQIIIS